MGNRQNITENINELLEEKARLLGAISDWENDIIEANKEIAEIDDAIKQLNYECDLLDGNDIICEPEE
jgi:chromosome segregation ATPase